MPVAEGDFLFMFIMFMSSLGMAVVFGILIFLATVMTPWKTFFKARIRKKPVLAAFRRDGKIDFHVVDEYTNGLVESKYGSFLVDENGAFIDKKSGVSVLIANAELGVTFSPNAMNIINAMRDSGYESVTAAEIADSLYYRCNTCGYEGIMEVVRDSNNKPLLDKDGNYMLQCPNEKEDNYEVQIDKPDESPVATEDTDTDMEHAGSK